MTQMSTSYDSLWDIGVIDIDGHPINKLREIFPAGKKLALIVNVASQAALADTNYEALIDLYNRYEKHGLEIIAFPCNQFGKQDPWNEKEIKAYVKERWDVPFPIMHKVKVNGWECDEVFKFLRSQTPMFVDKSQSPQLHGGTKMALKIKDISGNFCKFFVDAEGHVVDCLPLETDDPR